MIVVRCLERALVVAWLALSFCANAEAQATVLRRPALHWVRGEEALKCVDPRTMAERVEELVGPVLVRAPEAEHSVEAQVTRSKSDGLRVEVRVLNVWGSKIGERTFDQKGIACDALTPAIAFVIAMMIDPDVAAHGLPPALLALLGGERPAEEKLLQELEGEPPAPPLPPLPQPPVPVVPAHDAEGPPRDEPPPAARQQIAAMVRSAFHETPRVLVGVDLRYAIGVLNRRVAAAGYVRLGRQLGEWQVDSNRAVDTTTVDLGLQGCVGHDPRSMIRVQGCLGGELVNYIASGNHFERRNQTQVERTFGLVAQLTTRVRVFRQFGVMVSLYGRLAIPRRTFFYTNGNEAKVPLYRTSMLGGGFALGPSYEF